MKDVRNYIIIFLLALAVVSGSFFMPEISAMINGNGESSYTYETNKTSFKVSGNVPYAMKFTEVLSEAEIHYGNTNLNGSEARAVAENFFYGIKCWKYGCTLDFISAESYLCKSADYGQAVIWQVAFYSEALKSTLVFAVNDSANMVIGFNTYRADSDEKHGFLMENNLYYYIEKFLPDISEYYGWQSTYSNMETILNGVITYKVAFVDKESGSASLIFYYDYRNGNIIFNMNEDVWNYYRISEEITSEFEGA